ncbi:MAG: hypothetical protein ACXVCP_09115 [Bdellovibrio sp.]
MRIKIFSALIFIIAMVVFVYSAFLVGDGNGLYIFKKIAAFLIPFSLIFIINIWTGYPYVDLGGRFLAAFVLFFICFAVSCSSTKRERESPTDIKFNNSRFYVSTSGDQGALGGLGAGIYQEKEIIKSIYAVKELCFFGPDDSEITFSLVSPRELECGSNKNRYFVNVDP